MSDPHHSDSPCCGQGCASGATSVPVVSPSISALSTDGGRTDFLIRQMDCPTEEALIRGKLTGMAGVTGSGFIVLAATLSAVGTVPVAGLALILGIDRFMSEARALTNFIGNSVATLVVAKWCGALDVNRMNAVLNDETADEADRPELVLDDAPDVIIPHVPRPIVEHH